jgi:hypothetical protein
VKHRRPALLNHLVSGHLHGQRDREAKRRLIQ